MPAWITAIHKRFVYRIAAAMVMLLLSMVTSSSYDGYVILPVLVCLMSALISRSWKRVKWWKWLCGGALVLVLTGSADHWERTGWWLLLLAYPLGNWFALIWYGCATINPSLMILLGILITPAVIVDWSLNPALTVLSIVLSIAAGVMLVCARGSVSDTPSVVRIAAGRRKRAVVGFAFPIITAGILWIMFIINNRPPRFNAPIPVQLKANGWHDFVRAAKIIEIDPNLPSLLDYYEDDRELPAKYAALYERNKAALPVIRIGMSRPFQHPYTPSTFTTDWEEEKKLHSTPGIRTQQARKITLLLAAETGHYQQSSEYNKAVGSCLDIVDFGLRLPVGAGGCRTACLVESYGLSCFARILPKLGRSELDTAAQKLEHLQKARLPFKRMVIDAAGIDAEYQASKFSNEVFRRWWANPYHWFGPDMDYYLNSESRMSQAWRNTCFAFCNKQKLVQRNYDYMLELAREYDKPYEKQDGVAFPGGMIAESLLDEVCRGKIAYTQAQARFIIVKTAIALRRHLLDQGAYPEVLADLAPVYLKQLPMDSFCSNHSLAYKRLDNDHFLLYSRGQNMKDNGGKSTFEGDDITFESLLPKARPKQVIPPMPSPGPPAP